MYWCLCHCRYRQQKRHCLKKHWLLVLWLDRKRWRLWFIIQSGDSEQVEAARDWITPRLVPFLIQKYWQAIDWSKKRVEVELLQDKNHPDLPKLMLDFLRVPLEAGDEPTELAQAIALGFIGEDYDRFADYYGDRGPFLLHNFTP